MFTRYCNQKSTKRGFTLLELLIVIGIIAVISSVTILVINPSEYFKRSRDTQRIADLNNLHLAMTMYYTTGVSNFDLDGPNYTGSCATPGKVFISTPSGVAGPANLPSGWTYASSTSANLRKTNGSGWMPVNLDSIPAGSPLNTLPIDPVNDIDQALYYIYTCATSSPAGYELNANLESRQFNKGGKDDRTSKDGGDDPNVYEVGSRLTINPMAPMGYWAFDERAGTVAGDSSKNGYNGTLTDGPTWTMSGKVNNALSLDGLNDRVQGMPSDPFEYRGGDLTIMLWFNSDSGDTDGGRIISKPWNGNGEYNYGFNLNSDDTLSVLLKGATSWSSGNTSALSTNNWHHLAITLVGATKAVNIFLNGSLARSDTHNITDWTPGSGDSNISLTLGCLYPYGSGWSGNTGFCVKGIMDEVRIYNRALSAAEIQAIYNATK